MSSINMTKYYINIKTTIAITIPIHYGEGQTSEKYTYNDHNHTCLLCVGPSARFWEHRNKPDMVPVLQDLTVHWESQIHTVITMWGVPDEVGHLMVLERGLAQLRANTQTQHKCRHSNQWQNSATNLEDPKPVPIDFIRLSWTWK